MITFSKIKLLPLLLSLGMVVLFLGAMNCLLVSNPRYGFPVVHLELKQGVEQSYAGRYKKDPSFLSVFTKLPGMRQRALEKAQEKTGLIIADLDSYVIRFKDLSNFSPVGASSRSVRSKGGDMFLVTLSTTQLALGEIEVESVLVHEFIHGVMRERMGIGAYLSLPQWIREGIAVWGAGQIKERINNLIFLSLTKGIDFSIVIRDLKALHKRLDEYLMDALLFEYLSWAHGKGAVRNMLAQIVSGREPYSVFEEITGHNWSKLKAQYYAYAHWYLRRMAFVCGLDTFVQSKQLANLGDRPSAIEGLFSLLNNTSDPLLHSHAWYWIGRWSYEEQQYQQAMDAFWMVLKDLPDNKGLQQSSRYFLAKCFVQKKQYQQAQAHLERFFLDYPQAPLELRADAYFILGQAHFFKGEYPLAIRALLQASQESQNFAPDAFYYLCLAYLRSGQIFYSKLTLAELVYRYPHYEQLDQLRSKLKEQLVSI